MSLPAISQTHNEPKEVDLGLSVNWSDSYLDAEMTYLSNAGYFWASTKARKNFIEPNEEVPYDRNVGMSIAGTNYDCVTAALGNGWRMPTKAECEELKKLKVNYGVVDGKKGYTLTADNGNSVFFECYTNDNNIGINTQFWTADAYRESEESTDYTRAWICRISIKHDVDVTDVSRQDKWLWIRPVKDKNIIAASAIALSASELDLTIDESAEITTTFTPDNTSDKRLTFTSSDPTVATIDNHGIIQALSEGQTTITATAVDGHGVSASCVVKVSYPVENLETDLGLSMNWASYNVGAQSSREIGTYFQYANPSILTKWSITTSPYVSTRTLPVTNIAGTEYDPATKILGDGWMTPTEQQYQELYDNCTYTFTDNGVEFTSKINGNKITFPYTGFKYVSATNDASTGYYMTAVIDNNSLSNGRFACALFRNNSTPNFERKGDPTKGYIIRAVKKNPNSGIDEISVDPDATVDVYGITGIKILTGADRAALADLKPGIYIIRLSTGKTCKIKL